MLIVISLLVFVIVAVCFFVAASLIDERNSRARLMRERLNAAQKPSEREPSEELALLRDETLSKIPAFDQLLKRSQRVTQLQDMISQADMQYRVGNFLVICGVSGLLLGAILFIWSRSS